MESLRRGVASKVGVGQGLSTTQGRLVLRSTCARRNTELRDQARVGTKVQHQELRLDECPSTLQQIRERSPADHGITLLLLVNFWPALWTYLHSTWNTERHKTLYPRRTSGSKTRVFMASAMSSQSYFVRASSFAFRVIRAVSCGSLM